MKGQRRQHYDRHRPWAAQSRPYREHPQALEAQLSILAVRRERALAAPTRHAAARKVLTSLRAHWPGLTGVAAHPEGPLDNNPRGRHRVPIKDLWIYPWEARFRHPLPR